MGKNFHLAIIAFVSFFAACTQSKDFPLNDKTEQLHFGQGGGFTGAVNHYALLRDGRLFLKADRDTSYTYVDTWKSNFTNQMFENYTLLGLDKTSHYFPGNLYYFIEYHSREGKINRISWGQPDHKPDEQVVNFYNLLYRSTKPKS